MPNEQPGELDLPMSDRFLIIPLIVRIQEIPQGADGRPVSRITPDHVIDFYQAMERFDGSVAELLGGRG